jgi:hypothetical protein
MLLGLMLYLVFWGRMLRDVISLGRAACKARPKRLPSNLSVQLRAGTPPYCELQKVNELLIETYCF